MTHKFVKGNFSVIPNKQALRGQPPRIQLVWFWLCDYANENGQCFPSRKRLATDCKMRIQSIDKALRELVGLGMLQKDGRLSAEGDKDTNMYTLMEVGGVVAETHLPSGRNDTTGSGRNAPRVGTNGPHRTITNELKPIELKEDTNVSSAKADKRSVAINEMFDYWAEQIGYRIESKNQANRYACNNLLKKHGPEKLQQLVRGVALTHHDQYAPRIGDFIDLQAKSNQLIAWGKARHVAESEVRVWRAKT